MFIVWKMFKGFTGFFKAFFFDGRKCVHIIHGFAVFRTCLGRQVSLFSPDVFLAIVG